MPEITEETPKCKLCGEPMPPGEEMFMYHGYSGDCPKPPLAKPVDPQPFTAQPIGDYIVVRRIPEPEGLIVEADVAKDKPINCQVIAVSQHPSSDLARAALQALTPGDQVLIRRYSGTEVKVRGDEYTLVIIFDVLLKL